MPKGSRLKRYSWRSTLFMEIGEPLSWPLGILSIIVALAGFQLLDIGFYSSPIFIGILIGFISHEYMHRYVSRKYHMASIYTANVLGVVVTLVSSLFPIKLLMPGYVRTWTLGPASRKGVLYSVASGPMINIAIAAVLFAFSLFYQPYSFFLRGVAWINAYLSLFNLIPIPPLDGEKIIRLDLMLWIIMFVISLVFVLIL
ncbi:MAG: M50 family metallopeptidase [Caldisphaeraceae archaeon]|nr:M50 family metallopeptidase [Caldisphaeraceae archaeon]MEB3798325.1 M50 family metallopeptidase [Caldisphaeraceae archaeon]